MPRVNFKASSSEFVALPNASWPMQVDSVEITKSSQNNPMLKVQYSVLGEVPEGCGKKQFDQFSLLPQAGWKLKNFLEAAQVPHSAMPGANKGEFDIDFDTQDAVGKTFIGRTKQETYQKKNRDGSPVLDEHGQPVFGIRSNIEEYLKA